MASQSPRREMRREALGHLACRVFQPRCRPVELFEPRDRGVEVRLVEYFAAADHFAFDRHHGDPATRRRSPLREVPCTT